MAVRLRAPALFAVVVVACDHTASDRAPPTPTATAPTTVERLAKLRGLSFIGTAEAPAIAGERWSVPASHARPSLEGSLTGSTARISASADAWVELSRVDRGVDRGAPSGGAVSFADTTWAWSKRAVEHLHVVSTSAPIVLEMQVGPAIASVDVAHDRVWLKDAGGRARLTTDAAWVEDAKGTRRALHVRVEGAPPSLQLTLSFDGEGLVAPIVIDPAWTTVASMNTARVGAASVRMRDGRVLVAGGEADSSIHNTYEIYDPVANTWTQGSDGPGVVTYPYPLVSAVVLTTGKVFVGPTPDGGNASVYDPVAATWTSTPTLAYSGGAVAASLPGGRALIAGGYGGGPVTNAYIFDPVTNAVTATAPMQKARIDFGAVTLADGRVLVAGGSGDTTTEYFDPTTNTWSYGPSMSSTRSFYSQLVALTDGRIAVISQNADVEVLSGTTWTDVAALPGLPSHDAPNGMVAAAPLAGGDAMFFEWCYVDSCTALGAQRLHGSTLVATDPPNDLRQYGEIAVGLADGSVLVAGGAGFDEPLTSTEIFVPAAAASATNPATPCTAPGTCASLACVDGYCCDSAACAAGSTCGGPDPSAAGHCKLSIGQACAASSDCGSAQCVDGVCCATACAGQCEACDVAGSVGTCSPIAGAPHGVRAPCTATPTTCGLACDGIDPNACTNATANTPCSGDSCTAGMETHARFCDGAGSCPDVPTTCGAYVCGKTACATTCATDVDCATGFGCVASACTPFLAIGASCTTGASCASGACVDGVCCGSFACDVGSVCNLPGLVGTCSKKYGAACTASADCGEGSCVDGVCCDAACNGNCEACDVSGHEGTCTAVVGAPHGSRPACPTGASVCAAQMCDGSARATCAGFVNGATTTCAPASCSGDSAIAASSCDGAGNCVAPAASSCSPFLCANGACTATCVADTDCSTGFQCESARCIPATVKCSSDGASSVAPNGTTAVCAPYRCVATSGTCGQSCLSSSDCASSFVCVAGQCIAPSTGATVSSGGCAMRRSNPRATTAWLVLASMVAIAARRRRRDSARFSAPFASLALLASIAACSRHDAPVAARAPIAKPTLPTASPAAAAKGWSSATGDAFGTVAFPLIIPMPDGTVLTFGQPDVYRFDPKTNVNTRVGSQIVSSAGRFGARLPSGKILVVGGLNATGTGYLASAEIYDPATNTSTATTSMSAQRIYFGAITLPSGKVLVCGNPQLTDDNCEVYDEPSATWTPAATQLEAINGPMFTLASGKIVEIPLVGAGHAEIYDPTSGTWTLGGAMVEAYRTQSASVTVMPTGKIFVIGSDPTYAAAQIAEIYDPIADTFTATKAEVPERVAFCALAPLPSGRVICAGQWTYTDTYQTVPLVYDPVGDAWTTASPLPAVPITRGAVATPLADGRVFVTTVYGAAALFAEEPVGATCVADGDCSNLHCVDGVCCGTSACPSGSQCVAGSGTCLASDGTACASASACVSGNCVDGVCCNTACSDQCAACNVAGNVGTCAPVVGVPRGARAACGGAGVGTVCGASCDGVTTTQCTFATSAIACGTNACVSGIQTNVATCDGAGNCTDTSIACAPYACGATSCLTTCATTSDCAAGQYCASNACVPVEGLGTACTDASQCASAGCVNGVCCATSSCATGYVCDDPASKGTCILPQGAGCTLSAECATGHCIDGVCCDTACDGQCEACDVSGTIGKCTPIDGAPHGARPACAAADAAHPCAGKTCVGAKDATSCAGFIATATTPCAPSSCAGSTFTPASTCDGAGACAAAMGTACAPYVCNATGCLSACTLDLDCATGFVCRDAACVPKGAECTADLTASIGVDGVVTACAPYVCATDGKCGDACSTSQECAAGSVCDPSSQTCTTPAASSSGGCAIRSASSARGALAVALLVVGAWASRRRAARPAARG